MSPPSEVPSAPPTEEVPTFCTYVQVGAPFACSVCQQPVFVAGAMCDECLKNGGVG